MLKKVIRPDRKHVDFTYDALGRRLTKTYKEQTTHFVWDGNVPLHEWTSNVDTSISTINDKGETELMTPENLTTWVFEEGTFIPMAKIQGFKSYSIITDHLGTPVEAYDEEGKKVWSCHLDIYGKIRKIDGERSLIPFRYQGQYDDVETELYYNRYRYYSPESGTYVSQDPIGLSGKNPNFYAYTYDSNKLIDPLALDPLGTGGYSVYALYENGATDPYYIGITKQNVDTRMGQHMETGRYGANTTHEVLHSDLTIEQARGHEQFYIEKHGTKTGVIGEPIGPNNKGNKINSFDKTRTDVRGKAFNAEYEKLKKPSGCG